MSIPWKIALLHEIKLRNEKHNFIIGKAIVWLFNMHEYFSMMLRSPKLFERACLFKILIDTAKSYSRGSLEIRDILVFSYIMNNKRLFWKYITANRTKILILKLLFYFQGRYI